MRPRKLSAVVQWVGLGSFGMGTGLEHLLAEGVISEVLARLQSGKEAEVYVVLFGGKVVAAKVYKDRATRNFKNNAAYKEGRAVRNSRSQRAMDRGSKFGKAAAEDAWKTAEADALYKLHAAEVRVPTPVLYLDGVLLMELVLNDEGNAARRIIDTDLTVGQANAAYHDMVGQLVRILACDMIHGDLSPYNVLWAASGPTIIDFPQIISASHNSSSETFFLRDADNILGHFARIDRSLQSRHGDPWEIWQAYRRRELTPDFRPTGQTRATRPAFVPQRASAPQGPRAEAQRPGGRNDRPQQQHAPQGQRRGGPPPHGAPHSAPHRASHGPEVIARRPSIASPAPAHQTAAHAPPPAHPTPRHATHSTPRPAAGPSATPNTAQAEGERPPHRRRRRRR
jgi:RIO kinase 1